MLVRLVGAARVEVNESSGFVEVCVEADQDPRTFFSVSLTSKDGTAIGEYSTTRSLHSILFIEPQAH